VNKFKLALYGAFFNFTIDSSIVTCYTGFVIKKGSNKYVDKRFNQRG
jgi:hypothetical protein